jgi:hypothetical protein
MFFTAQTKFKTKTYKVHVEDVFRLAYRGLKDMSDEEIQKNFGSDYYHELNCFLSLQLSLFEDNRQGRL